MASAMFGVFNPLLYHISLFHSIPSSFTLTRMRLTKIICTVGPATGDIQGIRALAHAGMDIARVNLAHGTREQHCQFLQMLRELREREGLVVASLLDVKGPEIRTGDCSSPLVITEGEQVIFSPYPLPAAQGKVIVVNYEQFARDVLRAENILIDNGELSFDVLKVQGTQVYARCRQGGGIGSRRHINIPGADISLPALTRQDWQNVLLATEQDVDFIALSFVRTSQELQDLRAFLRERGAMADIIAKIETRQAVDHIDDIIAAADGVMVARGDLGVEIPFERVPAIQDHIVAQCCTEGKPVIIATHMLESMTEHPFPTRAEVTDVAHAAATFVDAVMLSGETARGKFPVACVQTMDRILQETESSHVPFPGNVRPSCNAWEARAEAAVLLARSLPSPIICVMTHSGMSARAVSRFRPGFPIIACTDDPGVERRLRLPYGVMPYALPLCDAGETARCALQRTRDVLGLPSGTQVVVLSETKGEVRCVP